MKTRTYVAMLLLVIPVQAALFNPLSLAGVKPDLAFALLYIIGLLTGPTEACLAGMAVGLLQDIGSASFLGLHATLLGLAGVGAGFLGKRVLDIASPMNIIFLASFSLIQGLAIAFFVQTYYGGVPFFSLLLTRIVPAALYTGLLGTLLLRFINRKDIMTVLMRRSLLKE